MDVPWEIMLKKVAESREHLKNLNQFYRDIKNDDLPAFSWLNPRAGPNPFLGVGSNDQHPDHDMRAGELLLKQVYEALRAGPSWNNTLFIVTYDEHGGFYDHVAPPVDIPPPNDNESSYPDVFKFDRLGLRVPTLLISPWVAKGRIESAPSATVKPFPNSEYDHTSILRTARDLIKGMENVGSLTDRDAWSVSFKHLLDLTSPREDCPLLLPDPIPIDLELLEMEYTQPLNDLQQDMLSVLAYLAGKHCYIILSIYMSS